MSGEGKRQAEFSGKACTEVTGAEKIYGNVGVFAGISMDALRGLWFAEIPSQLIQKFGKILACSNQRAAQGARCCGVAARGAADTQINATGKQRFECAELFGDGKRGVVRQHDAAGTDTNLRSSICNVTNQNGSRGTGDPSNVVMFSQPEAFVI